MDKEISVIVNSVPSGSEMSDLYKYLQQLPNVGKQNPLPTNEQGPTELISPTSNKSVLALLNYLHETEKEIGYITNKVEKSRILKEFAEECLTLLESVRVSSNDEPPYFELHDAAGNVTKTLRDLIERTRKEIERHHQRGHWGLGLKQIKRRGQRSVKAGPVYIHLGSHSVKSHEEKLKSHEKQLKLDGLLNDLSLLKFEDVRMQKQFDFFKEQLITMMENIFEKYKIKDAESVFNIINSIRAEVIHFLTNYNESDKAFAFHELLKKTFENANRQLNNLIENHMGGARKRRRRRTARKKARKTRAR